MRWFIILLLNITIIGVPAKAESPVLGRPTIIINPSVQVQTSSITLGEIAQISANTTADQPLVDKLRGISVGDSPTAGSTTSITGDKVLQVLRDNQVSLQDIGYSIPHEIVVSRASRVVTADELLPVAREALPSTAKTDLRIRSIQLADVTTIPTGKAIYAVQPLGSPSNGKLPLRIEVSVDGKVEARFLATAEVDYWHTVAVTKKNLERGMLISPEDLDLVKVNLTGESDDVIASVEDAVGQKAKQKISAGSPLRKSQIDYPPTVTRGAHVSIKYRDGILEATASGIIVSDGREGDIVPVQNETSKKIVKARVINPELVEVTVR